MPQYRFYTVPPNVRQMSFGELFVDFYNQLDAGPTALPGHSPETQFGFAPLFASPFDIRDGAPLATANVPEPTSLGDFVKLMRGPRLVLGAYRSVDEHRYLREHQVFVQRITNIDDEVQDAIIQCGIMSTSMWAAALSGELHFTNVSSSLDKTSDRYLWLIFVRDIMAIIQRDHPAGLSPSEIRSVEYFSTITECCKLEPSKFELVVRLLAMVSCGLGVAALEWSEMNLTPILAKFRGSP